MNTLLTLGLVVLVLVPLYRVVRELWASRAGAWRTDPPAAETSGDALNGLGLVEHVTEDTVPSILVRPVEWDAR